MPRRELFPVDRGLVARMIFAAAVTLLVVAGALVAVAALAPLRLAVGVAGATVLGVAASVRERAAARGRAAGPAAEPELEATVARLCVLADLPKPRIVVEAAALPNSWAVATGRGRARLHVTRGLLDRLEGAELEAVIAHELAHIANRDAAVMTVVGGPGAVLLAGGRRLGGVGGFWVIQLGGLVAAAIGSLAGVGSRALSRYRELAADAGAVAMTGNPAALASALMKVAAALPTIPAADLRVAAARDQFHLLPAAAERDGRMPRLLATHPSLAARVARLERMEARLQAARPAPRG